MTPINPRATHPRWQYVKDAVYWWLDVLTTRYPWQWPADFAHTHHICTVLRRAREILLRPEDEPDFPFNCNWTDEQLAETRERTVNSLLNHGFYEKMVLTCDDCGCRHRCMFAMDGYNTDGDCLADK